MLPNVQADFLDSGQRSRLERFAFDAFNRLDSALNSDKQEIQTEYRKLGEELAQWIAEEGIEDTNKVITIGKTIQTYIEDSLKLNGKNRRIKHCTELPISLKTAYPELDDFLDRVVEEFDSRCGSEFRNALYGDGSLLEYCDRKGEFMSALRCFLISELSLRSTEIKDVLSVFNERETRFNIGRKVFIETLAFVLMPFRPLSFAYNNLIKPILIVFLKDGDGYNSSEELKKIYSNVKFKKIIE